MIHRRVCLRARVAWTMLVCLNELSESWCYNNNRKDVDQIESAKILRTKSFKETALDGPA